MVDKCCCGCSLRTGTYIVAILFSLSCLAQVISLSTMAEEMKNDWYYTNSDRNVIISQAVISALMLLLNVLLLVGVVKERPTLIRPWLIIYSVMTGVNLVMWIYAFIIISSQQGSEAAISIGISMAIVFAIIFYCLIVVNSYYKLLLNPPMVQQPVVVVQNWSNPASYPGPYSAQPQMIPMQQMHQMQQVPEYQTPYMQQQMAPASDAPYGSMKREMP